MMYTVRQETSQYGFHWEVSLGPLLYIFGFFVNLAALRGKMTCAAGLFTTFSHHVRGGIAPLRWFATKQRTVTL